MGILDGAQGYSGRHFSATNARLALFVAIMSGKLVGYRSESTSGDFGRRDFEYDLSTLDESQEFGGGESRNGNG